MKVIDLHCDVLYKMALDEEIEFSDEQRLDAALPHLQKGHVRLQCFAIFISASFPRCSFYEILRQIDIWHEKILVDRAVMPVRSKAELQAVFNSGKIGAMLTLEGVDGLEGDVSLLRHAYRLGVRVVGLTWNEANWAADGVLESRNGKLTNKGRKLVKQCERIGMMIDVSHLGEASFWDLMTMSKAPVFASHSNAFALCPHPRNLTDEQIVHLITRNGQIGLTFVPYFLTDAKAATVSDVLRHLDHICSLGGVRHVGFGSDFDGIDQWVNGLSHAGQYEQLGEILSKYYKQHEVEGFLWENNYRFFSTHLPDSSI